ncbi:FMRFamide receptor 1 [Sarcoptes scabiei]|nr:FMRFamide receptor 1 [Sarcoptes scabiei]
MNFDEAVKKVRHLNQRPTDGELLQIYGLYKQATIGDCNIERPSVLDPKGRSKWDQWNSLRGIIHFVIINDFNLFCFTLFISKGFSKEQASNSYVDCVQNLLQKYGSST